MPVGSIHLVQLASGVSIASFVRKLVSHDIRPVVVARCVRWIIRPEKLSVSELLDTEWDIFFVLPSSSKDFNGYSNMVRRHWTTDVGIPSRIMQGFEQKNERLLRSKAGDVPELTGAMDKPRMADSTQGLELNDELLHWSKTFDLGQTGAVSMLNLLAFKSEAGSEDSYRRYGKAFGERIGKRRGGDAKLVGKVLSAESANKQHHWQEFALAHYPSIRHFVDMIASDDYQEVNHRDRLPSLYDTCILCTTELDPELWSGKSSL